LATRKLEDFQLLRQCFSRCIILPATAKFVKEQFYSYARQRECHNDSTYKRRLTDHEAQALVRDLTKDIKESRSYLKTQCSKYGASIRSKWTNKRPQKRTELLLEVDNTMYEFQWGEARHAYNFQNTNLGTVMRDVRNFNLLPYLNLEALQKDPARLLNLLYNRSHYPPEDWAAYDNHKLRLPWHTGAFEVMFNPNAVIMHGGPQYGELTGWNQNQAHCLEIIGFPKAQLILEAQAHVLRILRGVVERLTQGLLESCPDDWTKFAELGFKEGCSCEFASSFVNQPFSPPPTFGIDKLLAIATTRRDMSGDHVELLQREPSYLRHYVKLVAEYHLCQNCDEVDPYEVTARDIMNDIHTFWGWQWIFEEVTILRNASQVKINRGQPLPSALDNALSSLYAMLVYMIDRQSRRLLVVLHERPGFTSSWRSDFTNFPGWVKRERSDGITMADRFMKDPLDWCLTQLLGVPGEPDHPEVYELEMLFAFLHFYLAGASWEEKLRLDELIYDKYTDLAGFHEMRSMIHLCRPRFKEQNVTDVQQSEASRGWRDINRGFLEKSTAYHQLSTQEQTRSLGILLKAVCVLTPPHGKKDQQWIVRDDICRTRINNFFGKVRQVHRETLTELKFDSSDIEADLKDLSAANELKHLAGLNAERAGFLKILADEAEKAAKKKAPSGEPLQTHWGTAVDERKSPFQAKSKEKTRREEANASLEDGMDSLAVVEKFSPNMLDSFIDSTNDSNTKRYEQMLHIRVPLPKKTRSILRQMFPDESDSEVKCDDVPWYRFVLAMAQIGFAARHNGGSAVLFEPNSECKWCPFGGKIVFHRPHPDPTLTPLILKFMGKRMHKWFGWSVGTFILKK
jgi:hypothetical protein